MKLQNITIFLILLINMLGIKASAHNIEVANSDGITIYYDFIKNCTELSVSYKGYNSNQYPNEYTGNIVIPDSVNYNGVTYAVTEIGYNAFCNCTSLKSVTIPSSVIIIYGGAFYGCSSLTNVNIPNSVEVIDDIVFYGCINLTNVSIPNSVTYIGKDAFLETGIYAKSPDGVFYIDKWICGYKGTMPSNTRISIKEGTTSIANKAFANLTNLISVTIPNSVTNIGESAFEGCSGLTSITIPASVTGINNYVFKDCSELTSLIIPNSVTNIGAGAFWGCTNLMNLTIPNSVTSIGGSAFYGTAWYNNQPDGLVYAGKVAYIYKGSMPPNSNIAIQEGTLGIGGFAFNGCTNLKSMTIPNSVTNIGGSAFYGCSGLTNIDIPNSVTIIGDLAFYGCIGLTNLTIPNSVVDIASGAFGRCSNLENVTISNSVTYIGEGAFNACSNLTTVSIGYGIRTVMVEAFSFCPKLTDFYCFAREVPKTPYGDPFSDSNIKNATLHVPKSSISAYSEKSPWNDFKSITQLSIPEHTLTYMIDGVIYKTYQIEEGEAIAHEPEPSKEGYTFSGWSEIPETMPDHDVTITGTFAINKYKLIYVVNDEEYKTYFIEYGATITPEPAPSNEGYTFSGWSEIPSRMPAHDVTVKGHFVPNKYKLLYVVDGDEYTSYSIEYGATITPEPAPTKEGHTFSGWNGLPKTMPAHDVTVTGTFAANKYKLTYIVDGERYKSYEILFGETITPEAEPTKDGYTFSGWSWIPSKMPAEDVTVTGSFIPNMYKLIYVVDGEIYKTFEVACGSTIIPEEEPIKEGYSFSGWSWIPTKMPAEDVTVAGTFNINSYTLTYIVDSEEYKKVKYEYGASITPEVEPVKEGYTFSGWIDFPETMPAHDVTVMGTFSINTYTLTYVIGEEVYMQVVYEFGAAITPEPAPEGDYKTFEWVGVPETMPAHDVTVNAVYETGINALLMMAQQGLVRIYTPNGKQIDRPQRGLNIVVLSDTKMKKVVVK